MSILQAYQETGTAYQSAPILFLCLSERRSKKLDGHHKRILPRSNFQTEKGVQL